MTPSSPSNHPSPTTDTDDFIINASDNHQHRRLPTEQKHGGEGYDNDDDDDDEKKNSNNLENATTVASAAAADLNNDHVKARKKDATTTTTPSIPSASEKKNHDRSGDHEEEVKEDCVVSNDDNVDGGGAPSEDDRGEKEEVQLVVVDPAAAASSSSSSSLMQDVVAIDRDDNNESDGVVVCIPSTTVATTSIPHDQNEGNNKHSGENGRQDDSTSLGLNDVTTTDHKHEDCSMIPSIHSQDVEKEDVVGGGDGEDGDCRPDSKREQEEIEAPVQLPLSDGLDTNTHGDNNNNNKDETTSVMPASMTTSAAPTNDVKMSEKLSKDGTRREYRDEDDDGDGGGLESKDSLSNGILSEDVITNKKTKEGKGMETNEDSERTIVVVGDDNADVPETNAAGLTTAKNASIELATAMDEYTGNNPTTNTPKMRRFHPKRPRLPFSASSPTSTKGDTFSTATDTKEEDPKKEEAGLVESIVANSGNSSDSNSSSNNNNSSKLSTIISPREYHLRFCLLRKRRQITKDMRMLRKIMPPAAAAMAAAAAGEGGQGGGTTSTTGNSSTTADNSDASTIRSDAATVPSSNRIDGLGGLKGGFPTPTSYNSNPSSSRDASSISRSQGLAGRGLPLPFQDAHDEQQLQQWHGPSGDSSDGKQLLRSQLDSASSRYGDAATKVDNRGRRHSSYSSAMWDSFDNASSAGLDSISPAPFKVVMTKEDLDKKIGCTPVDERGSNNNRGNPDVWKRMMTSMMAGKNNHGEMGVDGMDGGDRRRQEFSELLTPASTMKRTVDDVYNSGYDKNSGISSLLGKRTIDHVLQGGSGDAGMNNDSYPSKSPLPKKSFLHRERIMDEVMRKHMKDALEDMQRSHHMNSHFSTPRELNVLPHADMAENNKSLMLPLSSGSGVTDENTAIGIIHDTAKKVSNSKSDAGERENKISRSASSKKSKNDTSTKKSQQASSVATLTTTPTPQKPRRPFSAYNLFFQLEREFIMNELNEGRKPQDELLIKQALKNVEKGGAAADDEKEESGTEITTDVGSTNKEKDEDDDNATTDDPVSTDLSNQNGDKLIHDGTASSNVKDKDGKSSRNDELASTSTKSGDKSVDISEQQSDSKYFVDPEIPQRYAHLRLEKHWHSVSHKQKRKHRKTEGSCSFMELTTMVSARWKLIDETDPHVKQYCRNLALMELSKYKEEIALYKSALKDAEKNDDGLINPSKGSSGAVASGLKIRGRKNKKAGAEDSSSPPRPEPQPTEFGRGRHSVDDVLTGLNPNMLGDMDMSRLIEFARMSGSLQGALHAFGNSQYESGGGSGGLPPPPFADDSYRNAEDRARMAAETRMNNRARLAAELAEARMAEARVAAGLANWHDPIHETSMMEALALAEARSYGTLSDDQRMFHGREAQSRMASESFGYDQSAASNIQRQFAALAEAEARHRMQLEIQANMIGNNIVGGGGWSKYDDGVNPPRNAFDKFSAASNMPRLSHDTGAQYSENFPGRGSFPQHGETSSSSLQRKFLEFAGMSDGNISSSISNSGSHNFEAEVENFLSNLGQEIRMNRQKLVGSADGGGASAGFGGNFGMEVRGESSRGGRMGDPMGMRAEMLKQMMMGGNGNTGGSSSRSVGDNTSPGAMAEMLMMRKRIAEAGRSNYDMTMPGPPLYGSEPPTQQGNTRGGGDKGDRGGDDDNPALPEYDHR